LVTGYRGFFDQARHRNRHHRGGSTSKESSARRPRTPTAWCLSSTRTAPGRPARTTTTRRRFRPSRFLNFLRNRLRERGRFPRLSPDRL
jgi:hypothetical protein